MIQDLFERNQTMDSGVDLTKDVEAGKVFAQLGDRLGLDIHFYLICWDKVDKYLGRFSDSEKENSCVKTVWDSLHPLTKKASKARHFFEHLHETITESNFGKIEYAFANFKQFSFRYVDVSKKGERFEREVALGRAEVERVMLGYEGVLACLGADVSSGYSSRQRTYRP
jgi:hypothetical protein